MPKKMGRPLVDNPKDYEFRIRLDREYKEKLNYCSKKEGISKSDVVRKGIDLVKNTIDGK